MTLLALLSVKQNFVQVRSKVYECINGTFYHVSRSHCYCVWYACIRRCGVIKPEVKELLCDRGFQIAVAMAASIIIICGALV